MLSALLSATPVLGRLVVPQRRAGVGEQYGGGTVGRTGTGQGATSGGGTGFAELRSQPPQELMLLGRVVLENLVAGVSQV